jgi:hypothetical protein
MEMEKEADGSRRKVKEAVAIRYEVKTPCAPLVPRVTGSGCNKAFETCLCMLAQEWREGRSLVVATRVVVEK